jgi:hypothetical protein
MVKVGFICEGFTEEFILQSDSFQAILQELNLESVEIINAKGNKNLLPHNISKFRNELLKLNAKVIIILTDLDDDESIQKTKLRITEQSNQLIIIAVKQIESWFLADIPTMKAIFSDDYSFEYPEKEDIPFETIRTKYLEKFNRGLIGKNEKIRLAKKMLNYGFSIQNAANHPNCPSAKYFLTKLQSITN